MIIFKTIRWQNLLSTGNQWTEVNLNSHKTTLMVGQNGAGKSTILDAIMFVLYNKPFRKVNKGQLINSVTNKNLLVEIDFEKGGVVWLVRRGSKPNIFEIHKAGELIPQDAENKDYQGILENIVGMNSKAFAQVVMLGSASFVPFMQLPTPERRKVIEDLLDIQIFSDMGQLLTKRVSAAQSEVMDAASKVTIAKTKLDMAIEVNQKQSGENQKTIAAKADKIEALRTAALEVIEKMEAEQANLDTIKFDPKKIETITKYKRDAENEIISLKEKIRHLEKHRDFLSKNENCPTCAQQIAAGFKAEEVTKAEEEIARLAERGHEQILNVETLTKELDEYFELNKKVKRHEAMITEFNREVEWYRLSIVELENEIEGLRKVKELTDIAPLEKALEKATEAHQAKANRKKLLDTATLLLKDNGIKAVIVRKYMPVLNSLINQYLTQLDFFVNFHINETFEETIKSRFRDEFSYESFSEGEKFRIDLALLFAWRAISKMRNSAATNLLIFDEVLDSSLDQNGIDELMSIIQTLAENENIFIISHRGDAIGDKFDRVLRFHKVKGFSQLAMAS